MEKIIKKCYESGRILGLVAILSVVFFGFTTFYDIQKLKSDVVYINKRVDSIYIDKMQSDGKKEIENSIQNFYDNITTNTISRINCAISMLAVIATIFAVFGICISFININAFRDIDKKSKMIEDCKEQIDELRAMQYLLLGKVYQMSENKNGIRYAIEEYEEAKDLPNSKIIITQLIDVYSDLFEKTKNGKFLELCIDYCIKEEKKEKKEDNKPILIDWYFTMGCLYGVIAKNISKIEYDLDKDELLKKSKNSFIKAIHMEDKNYQFYTNLAVTSYYLKDEKNVIKYLKKAKKCIDEDELLENRKIDIFEIFDINDMKEIGYKDWVKYKKQVGIQEVDIETKDKFEQKIEG